MKINGRQTLRNFTTERPVSLHERLILRVGHRICAAVYSGNLNGGFQGARLPVRKCICPQNRVCDHMRLAAEHAIDEIMKETEQ